MTENYYLIQSLLPFYFSNEKNREFFYNIIGKSPENVRIFFEKEIYGWVKEDFYRQKVNDKNAVVPEEEKIWKYKPIDPQCILSDNKEWVIIFVKFPPDFVSANLDCICLAIAMKRHTNGSIEVKLFMLETGKNHNNEPAVYVCTRNIVEYERHINLGEITFDEHFMSTFAEKVLNSLK